MVAWGAALWLIGQVEILKLALLQSGFNARSEFGRQFALLLDGSQDGCAAILQVSEVSQLLRDGSNLNLVQISGGFFPVAGDERDSAAFIQKPDASDEPLHGNLEGFRDMKENFWRDGLELCHAEELHDNRCRSLSPSAEWQHRSSVRRNIRY